MAGRLSSLTSRFMGGPDYEEADPTSPDYMANLVGKNKAALAPYAQQAPQQEAPETPDPSIYQRAQDKLGLANLVHSFTGAQTLTPYGVKHGQTPGTYNDSPGWQAVRAQAGNEWSQEQMRVANANKLHAFNNQYSKMKTEVDNKNNQAAIDASREQAIAAGSRSMMEEMLESQERIQHEKTQAVTSLYGAKAAEANLKPPNDHQQRLAQLGYETEQLSNRLAELIQKHGGTHFAGDMMKTDASALYKWIGVHVPPYIRGKDDAIMYKQLGDQLAAHLQQIQEVRRSTGLMNDQTAALVPPAGMEDQGALDLVEQAKKVGQRHYRMVIDTPGGALWAWQTHSENLPWRRLINKEALRSAHKTRLQLAQEANSQINGFLNDGGMDHDDNMGKEPLPPNGEPPGLDDWMRQKGIR